MGLTVTVAGVDISALVDVGTLSITEVLTRRGDTASFDILDATLARTYSPLQAVTITDELGNVKFGGVLTIVGQSVADGPGLNRWKLRCQDYTYYLQHTLCNKKYQNQSVDAIAKDLLARFPPGVTITTTNVQANLPVLPTFNAPHLTLSSAFDKLVRLSNTTAFLMWDVDPSGDLHFFDQNHVPAADVTLTDVLPSTTPQPVSDAAVYSGGLYGVLHYGVYSSLAKIANYARDTFEYQEDASQFANQITFRGGTSISNPYAQTWVGNGQQTSFLFDYGPNTTASQGGYPPDETGTGSANLTKVSVGGAYQTVTLDNGGGFGSYTCLVSLDQQSQTVTLRFATAPANAAVIVATYVYDFPILQRLKDAGSITSYQTWEEYVTDTTVKSIGEAAQRAGSMLSQFAHPLATATVDVDRTYRGSLGAGQLVPLVNTQLGLNVSMIVTDVTITGQPGGGYRHSLRLAAFA